MFFAGDKATRGGFTLVEIMIAIAILGILAVIAATNFGGMNEKYKVEAETKQLYADLMDARGRAMQRNRVFFVQINANDYQTYEDAYTLINPDGDGSWQNTDKLVVNERVSHVIATGNIAVPLSFNFNRNGLASVTGFIRFSSTVKPDYDCIWIRTTRIKMGQTNAAGTACAEK